MASGNPGAVQPEFVNSIIPFMLTAGGAYPIGTTFPNHVVMGVQGKWVPNGRKADYVVQVTDPNAEAAKAGIQAGDVIQKVAGKSVGSEANLLDALAKGAKVPSYPVELLRGGQIVKVTLNRQFRPAIAALTFNTSAQAPANSNNTSTGSPAQALSIADELAKFAKLRDQGIISPEEFENQKRKLLGQ